MKDLDKYRGCLIGGAAGDALGYAVDGMSEDAIFTKYGPAGITEYDMLGKSAQISAATQMTLFTAKGILLAPAPGKSDRILGEYRVYTARAMADWVATQKMDWPIDTSSTVTYTDLVNIPELFSRRSPEPTTMEAIGSGDIGRIEEPINDSKECGGVVRVAPVGLYFGRSLLLPSDKADAVGAHIAAVTHGHQMGYVPAAVYAHMIRRIVHEGADIAESAVSGVEMAKRMFPEAYMMPYFEGLIERALELAEAAKRGETEDGAAINALGGAVSAEQALAAAVYCAVRYDGDIDKALIAAVNHGGSSCAAGTITGSILGAKAGLSGIPVKYLGDLELAGLIIGVADDMYKYGL